MVEYIRYIEEDMIYILYGRDLACPINAIRERKSLSFGGKGYFGRNQRL
jgi:hypothetical protein